MLRKDDVMYRLTKIISFTLINVLFLFAQQGIVKENKRQNDQVSLETMLELMKLDIKAKKIVLINESMNFTPQEEEKFWPVYKKYDAEMSEIFDDELELIKEYARNYVKMTGDLAEKLLERSLQLEEKKIKIKRNYFKRFKESLPTVKAVKFYQVDGRINRMIELQIMAQVPVLEAD